MGCTDSYEALWGEKTLLQICLAVQRLVRDNLLFSVRFQHGAITFRAIRSCFGSMPEWRPSLGITISLLHQKTNRTQSECKSKRSREFFRTSCPVAVPR